MLGRVRACSLSSLEVLEMEFSPSKLLKDDSLSIYEKTLLKLQKGSQRDLNITIEESTNTSTSSSITTISSNEALMAVNSTDFASTDSTDSQSVIISKEEPHRNNLSVIYMFSKYKISKRTVDRATAMEDDCSFTNDSPVNDHEHQKVCIVDPPSPLYI